MSVRESAIDPSVVESLRQVYDPCCRDKGISIVDMGLLHQARVEQGVARVELLLTSGWCPFATTVVSDVKDALLAIPEVDSADVEIVWDEPWSPARLSDRARERLRFLPDPVTVGDPASYVGKHWTNAQHRGGTDDR